MSPYSFERGRWALFIHTQLKMNESELIALLVTAAVGTLGIIKFKLIEEFIKKVSGEENVKFYSIGLLLVLAIGSAFLVTYLTAPSGSNIEPEEIVQAEIASEPMPAQKSDLEVKVEAVKDGIDLTKELVKTAKDNKQRKDSIFEANKSERWVYQINDWTDDEDRIVEVYKSLSMTDNVKLLKIKKLYLFIKDDQLSKQELTVSIDSLEQTLPGLKLTLYDLHELTTRKKDRLVERMETFGKRKKKVKIPCLALD